MKNKTWLGIPFGCLLLTGAVCNLQAEALPDAAQLLQSAKTVAQTAAQRPPVSSDTPDADGELGADELVAQVLAANAAIRSRSLSAAAAEQRVSIAGALDDPKLSYGVAPRTFGSDLDGRHLIQISQSLPWFGKRDLRRQQAANRASLASTSVDQERLELAAQTRKLWAQWWFVHRALTINTATRSLLADLLPVAETQYAYGSGRQQDLLQVQTRQQMLEREALALQAQQQQLQAMLNALRGQAPDSALAAPAAIQALPTDVTPAALQAQLLANNPDLAGMADAVSVAESGLALAEREFYPDLRVYSAYVGTLDPTEKRWQVGVEINVPFARGKRRAAVAAAELERDALEQGIADTRLRLLAELDQAFAMLRESQATIELYQDGLIELARQTLEAARNDYANGRGEFGNVIDAEQVLLRSRLDLAEARSLAYQALAEINRLSGGGVWDPANAAQNQQMNEMTNETINGSAPS